VRDHLQEVRAGAVGACKGDERAAQAGISEQTLYAWRKKFGELEVADAKRRRAVETENARLKKLLAERDLEIEVMKEIGTKIW